MKRYLAIAPALLAATVLTAAVLAGCSTTGSTTGIAPQINSINPNFGLVGTQATINGFYFGTSQGNGQVTFHGVAAVVGSWSDTTIVVTVPEGAETGDVIVTTSAGSSNAVTFTVSSTATGPTPAPQQQTPSPTPTPTPGY